MAKRKSTLRVRASRRFSNLAGSQGARSRTARARPNETSGDHQRCDALHEAIETERTQLMRAEGSPGLGRVRHGPG
jgi:hypothetical protein